MDHNKLTYTVHSMPLVIPHFSRVKNLGKAIRKSFCTPNRYIKVSRTKTCISTNRSDHRP